MLYCYPVVCEIWTWFDTYHQRCRSHVPRGKDLSMMTAQKYRMLLPTALAHALRSDLPKWHRRHAFSLPGEEIFDSIREKGFYETNLLRIEHSFFDVFDFPLCYGDKRNAVKGRCPFFWPETSSKKYFGNENPWKNSQDQYQQRTGFCGYGILKDIPLTHILLSMYWFLYSTQRRFCWHNWNWNSFILMHCWNRMQLLRLSKNKLQPLFNKYQPKQEQIYAQLMTDIHLKSNLKWELGANGDFLI